MLLYKCAYILSVTTPMAVSILEKEGSEHFPSFYLCKRECIENTWHLVGAQKTAAVSVGKQ